LSFTVTTYCSPHLSNIVEVSIAFGVHNAVGYFAQQVKSPELQHMRA